LLDKYDKLEKAYNITLSEIETVINDDDVSLNILRENLKQILTTIKEDKAKISLKGDSTHTSEDNTKQLEDMLNMSKEVLAERLLEEKSKNEKLTIDNRKLYNNLKRSLSNFDIEKNNNVKLNDNISLVRNQIKSIQEEGDVNGSEIKTLERQKNEIERKLVESNKAIKVMDEQIQSLAEIIRKININCSYIYERGNPEEQATIYLTSLGMSEKYVKYFVRNKPDIYVEFRIAKDFFPYEVSKLELKFFNSLNVQIYSVTKEINTESFKIIIPNKNFPPGKYSIEILAGDEQLILDDKYMFKISN
jgi:chromosome segregation ATPase